MPERGVNMTSQAIAAEMGQRVAYWLRQAYPRDGAKLAAQEFKASPHTTRRWLEGGLPESRHLQAMASKWGKRFVAFVYEPVVGPWGEYGIEDDIAELRASVERLTDCVARGPFVVRRDAVVPRAAAETVGRKLSRPLNGVPMVSRQDERSGDVADRVKEAAE